MAPSGLSSGSDTDPRKLATALVNEGRFNEAINLLLPVSDRWGNDAGFWRILGVAQGSAGDLDDAENSLRRAISLNPDAATSHYHLAEVLLLQGDVRESRGHAERAVALDDQMEAARALIEKLDAKKRAMRATGFYVSPSADSPAMAEAVRAFRQKAAAPGADAAAKPAPADVAAPAAARTGGAVQLRASRSAEEDPVTRAWSWDGFVWGLAAPVIWLAAHYKWMWGVVALAVETGLWAFDWLHPSLEKAGAAIALQVGVGAYLGWRGNALSVSSRLWLSLGEFRRCHSQWLYWGLGTLAAMVALAATGYRSPAVAEQSASLRTTAIAYLHHR